MKMSHLAGGSAHGSGAGLTRDLGQEEEVHGIVAKLFERNSMNDSAFMLVRSDSSGGRNEGV